MTSKTIEVLKAEIALMEIELKHAKNMIAFIKGNLDGLNMQLREVSNE